jgi:cobalt-zinc-cadmium efflux system outer membrane protein
VASLTPARRALRASLWLLPSAMGCGCAGARPPSALEQALSLARELAPGEVVASRAAVGAGPLVAPEPGAPARVVRLDEVLRLALARSARLAELRARVEVARLAVGAAWRFPNPELRFAPVVLDQLAAGEVALRPQLRFAFPRPFENEARMAAARAEEALARGALQGEEQALEAEVRWLYDDARLFDAELVSLRAIATSRRLTSERVSQGTEVGAATQLERSLAELSALDVEHDLAGAEQRRAAAVERLLDRVGGMAPLDLRAGDAITLEGEPIEAWKPVPIGDDLALVQAALRRSPAVGVSGARLDAARASIDAERARQWPWLTLLGAGYQFGNALTPGFTLQLGLELPVFDTNRAAVQRSEAAVVAEAKGLAAEVERTSLAVRERARAVRSAEALVASYLAASGGVLSRAREASASALASPGLDVVRALELDQRRAAAELRLVRLVRAYRSALADLRRAVGGTLPSER